MNTGNRRNIPYVNYMLITLNALYFLFLELVGSSQDLECMIRYGALVKPLVLGKGEFWRLLTAMFMHFGIEHIANNMLILFVLGDNLERALGKVKYLFFYLTCGIGANVVSLFVGRTGEGLAVSAGASGAIFGVIGGLLYAVTINRGRLEDLSTRQLVVMIAFSLYFGFTSAGVNNAAHVAGLVIGIVMAVILYRKPRQKTGWIKEERL